MAPTFELDGDPRLHPDDVRKLAKSVPGCRDLSAPPTGTEISQTLTLHPSGSDDTDETPRIDTSDGNGVNVSKVISFLVDPVRSAGGTVGGRGSGGGRRGGGAAKHGSIGSIVGGPARINVYCQTGTVGTCRILNGEVREVFTRRCTLDGLERILRDPPTPACVDARWFEDGPDGDGDGVGDGNGNGNDDVGDAAALAEERSLRRDIDLADTGLAILMGEVERLTEHARLLEEAAERSARNRRRQSGGDDEESSDGGGGGGRGGDNDDDGTSREFAFHIPEATVSHVEEFLADSVADPVKCVATNGVGTALIYRSGEWAHTDDVPKKLRKALKGRVRDQARASYVSLGTNGRYLVAFEDGTAEWSGPDALDRTLLVGTGTGPPPPASGKKKSKGGGGGGGGGGGRPHRPISSVAFGSTKDTYFVVFGDGSWEYRGRGIPDGLVSILSDRGERADLVTVTLGPDGEWFLRARNGKMWWGNATEEFDELMDELEDSGRTPHFVDFGDYGSYFVSHE